MSPEFTSRTNLAEIQEMIEGRVLSDPLLFFHWADDYGEKNLKNADILEINHFCLTACDKISLQGNSDDVFKRIVSQARFMCIEPDVRTASPRVLATFCLKAFMEKFAGASSVD